MRLLAAVAAVVILVSGCGGGVGNGGDAPAAPTTAAPTTAAPSTSEPPQTAPPPTNESSLNPAMILVRADELTPGWQSDEFSDDVDPSCVNDLARDFRIAADFGDDGADALYSRDTLGPFLYVAVLANLDDAARSLDEVGTRFAECDGTTDGTYDFELAPLTFPPLGDDSFDARLDGTAGEATFALLLAAARVDDTVVFGLNFGFDDTTDVDLLEEAVRTMVDRS